MFIEFSTASSFDFGRRRENQLPDGLVFEEVEMKAETDQPDTPESKVKMGFQKNEEID